jgi:hypothetical protein
MIANVIAVNVILFIAFSSLIGESIYLVFRALFVLPKELGSPVVQLRGVIFTNHTPSRLRSGAPDT